MDTLKIVEGAIQEIMDVRGHVAKDVGFVELIDEFSDQIESWEYYSSDGDLNFYDEDDELVLSFRVEKIGQDWTIILPRER